MSDSNFCFSSFLVFLMYVQYVHTSSMHTICIGIPSYYFSSKYELVVLYERMYSCILLCIPASMRSLDSFLVGVHLIDASRITSLTNHHLFTTYNHQSSPYGGHSKSPFRWSVYPRRGLSCDRCSGSGTNRLCPCAANRPALPPPL